MTTRPNLHSAEFEYDDEDPPGYRSGIARVGVAAGGRELAVKLFELPPAESLCPYHYEYVEEWLLVLEGELELRTPAGTEQLRSGDLASFPAGPEGAHKTTNRGQTTARFVMFSSAQEPSVAVYPDSDKIGVWVPGGADNVMLRRGDGHVAYFDGEG
jgi:uncharacterized cupin superfamily protein